MKTTLFVMLAALFAGTWTEIDGHGLDNNVVRPDFSKMASVAKDDGAPCDVMFLQDDQGKQDLFELWGDSFHHSQVNELYGCYVTCVLPLLNWDYVKCFLHLVFRESLLFPMSVSSWLSRPSAHWLCCQLLILPDWITPSVNCP